MCVDQGWRTSVLESLSPAEFCFNPNQTHLNKLIKAWRVTRKRQAGEFLLGLELNSAGLRLSRTGVRHPWCRLSEFQSFQNPKCMPNLLLTFILLQPDRELCILSRAQSLQFSTERRVRRARTLRRERLVPLLPLVRDLQQGLARMGRDAGGVQRRMRLQ